MYLFFKLIHALEEPKLSKEDWGMLAEIFQKLAEKTFAKFNNEFFSHITAAKKTYTNEEAADILEFMRLWFKIVDQLTDLNNYIHQVCKAEVKPDVTLTNDDMTTILTPLLPANPGSLKNALSKIEFISRVCMKDIALTNLLGHVVHAFSRRVSQIETGDAPKLPCSFNTAQLKVVTNELYMYLIYNKIFNLCLECRNSIGINFFKYLKQNDEIAYFYYFKIGGYKNIHAIIKDEIESINFEAEHIRMTPSINLLITKHCHMTDLLETLKDENHSISARIYMFCKKFDNYLSQLQQRVYEPGTSIFSSVSYTDTEIEDEFLYAGSAILKKISQEVPSHSYKRT